MESCEGRQIPRGIHSQECALIESMITHNVDQRTTAVQLKDDTTKFPVYWQDKQSTQPNTVPFQKVEFITMLDIKIGYRPYMENIYNNIVNFEDNVTDKGLYILLLSELVKGFCGISRGMGKSVEAFYIAKLLEPRFIQLLGQDAMETIQCQFEIAKNCPPGLESVCKSSLDLLRDIQNTTVFQELRWKDSFKLDVLELSCDLRLKIKIPFSKETLQECSILVGTITQGRAENMWETVDSMKNIGFPVEPLQYQLQSSKLLNCRINALKHNFDEANFNYVMLIKQSGQLHEKSLNNFKSFGTAWQPTRIFSFTDFLWMNKTPNF